MKKKLIKKSIGISLMVTMICSLWALPVNAATESKVDAMLKIDSVLMEKLSEMEDSDIVDVSVWFKDINQDEFEDEVKAEVKDKIDSKKLDSKIIKVFDKNLSADELHNELKDVDQSEFQDVVETKRKIHVNKQEKNNAELFDSVFPKSKWSWEKFRYVESDQPQIIYQSKLTPNIEMKLTKSQVLEIVNKEEVTQIYAVEENAVSIEDSIYSTACFENTGIKNLNTRGFTGEGVRIGVYDSGPVDTEATYFANSSIVPYNNIATDLYSGDHGNNVACILVGKQNDYCGVAPDAQLFYVDQYTIGYRYKQAVEWLITEKNVNVINISLSISIGQEYDTVNQYNEASQWFDHVSYQDNVTIVMSSGNNEKAGVNTGVWSGNMGYNVITVGAYDDKNTADTSTDAMNEKSRYNGANTEGCVYTYKPDIVAPGGSIKLPTRTFSGTSAATPFITGSVALLMEADPYLKTRPDLVKALIMVGADAENFITMSEANTTEPTEAALNRQYGAGALNVANSLESCSSSSSYFKYYTGQDSSIQFTKSVLVPFDTELLRVALCFSKCNYYNDGFSHTTTPSSTNFTQVSLPVVSLKVQAPDGTTWYCKSTGNNVQLLSMDVSDCGAGSYSITVFREGPPTGNTYYSLAILNGDAII